MAASSEAVKTSWLTIVSGSTTREGEGGVTSIGSHGSERQAGHQCGPTAAERVKHAVAWPRVFPQGIFHEFGREPRAVRVEPMQRFQGNLQARPYDSSRRPLTAIGASTVRISTPRPVADRGCAAARRHHHTRLDPRYEDGGEALLCRVKIGSRSCASIRSAWGRLGMGQMNDFSERFHLGDATRLDSTMLPGFLVVRRQRVGKIGTVTTVIDSMENAY